MHIPDRSNIGKDIQNIDDPDIIEHQERVVAKKQKRAHYDDDDVHSSLSYFSKYILLQILHSQNNVTNLMLNICRSLW